MVGCMTPQERAKKIFVDYNGQTFAYTDEIELWLLTHIAAQIAEAVAAAVADKQSAIEEAEREAYLKGHARVHLPEEGKQQCDVCFKLGFNAAREMAKGILETRMDRCSLPEYEFLTNACKDMADEIGKMEPK